MKFVPNCSPARDERGFAMAGLLLVVLLLTVVGTYAVMQTAIDTRITSHHDTGNRAFYAAESGVMHALNSMNGPGVINFQTEVANRWDQLLGTGFLAMPSDVRSGYALTVAADPTNPRDRGRITAVGTGPLLARRTIEITLGKGGYLGPPGALHIAADDNVTADFRGNSFEVDGNNHDRFYDPVNDGRIVPGISTRNSGVNNTVTNALNTGQIDKVKGAGFSLSPLTPSILPVGGPGVADLDNFVNELLTNPSVVTTNQRNFNGNDVFGTPDNPQITYMTDPNVRLNGNAEGAGILIADGSVNISGTLDFVGLIIVRGDTIIDVNQNTDGTTVVGTAAISGSLWTGNLRIIVGGNALIQYCHECLQIADFIGGQANLLPRPMSVLAWGEVL